MWLKNAHSLTSTVENQSLATDIPHISEMVEAARRLTSIEFSFDPCNIYRNGPRGVGHLADARSVGDSHPCCYLLNLLIVPKRICFHTCWLLVGLSIKKSTQNDVGLHKYSIYAELFERSKLRKGTISHSVLDSGILFLLRLFCYMYNSANLLLFAII